MSAITDLPESVLVHLLSLLDVSDVGRCAAVCRFWHECTQSRVLWWLLSLRDFPQRCTDLDARSWRDFYEQTSTLRDAWPVLGRVCVGV